MSKKESKIRIGVVYSTDPSYQYQTLNTPEPSTLAPQAQKLKVLLDTKQRAGKKVSIVSNFVGTSADLELLAKHLKNKCGVGGSTKEGEIIIQGDFVEKIKTILSEAGYGLKK